MWQVFSFTFARAAKRVDKSGQNKRKLHEPLRGISHLLCILKMIMPINYDAKALVYATCIRSTFERAGVPWVMTRTSSAQCYGPGIFSHASGKLGDLWTSALRRRNALIAKFLDGSKAVSTRDVSQGPLGISLSSLAEKLLITRDKWCTFTFTPRLSFRATSRLSRTKGQFFGTGHWVRVIKKFSKYFII